VFLVKFLQSTADSVAIRLELLNGGLFPRKEANNDQRRRNEVGVRLSVQYGLPAFLHDHVHIILHDRLPVVQQVLIHVIGVYQTGIPEGGEQFLR
jgi:hypothetical protein